MRRSSILTPLIFLLLTSFMLGQTFQETGKLEWIVKDREYSRGFLEAYIETLLRVDESAELEVQETDELRVIVAVDVEGKPSLENIYAKGRSGVLNRLDKTVLDSMDASRLDDLQKRRYMWDYLSEVDVGGGRSEVINVFEEVSNKQVRDAFWWTHRRVDISVFPRIFLRVNPNFAFAAEFGRPDLGYPSAASRTLNLGMATEILKFYVTIPTAGYLNLTSGSATPLEGTFGGILKFDSPNFGGSISFQDMKFRSDTDFEDPDSMVYNPYSGQFYYSFTSRIGSAPDQPGFVPLGSLRLQIGFTYMQYAYGFLDPATNDFMAEDKSSPLNSVAGLFRIEYASNMNDRYFNRIKLASQLNIGLDGFGSVDLNTTYTIMEWLGVNLDMTYFWMPMEFSNVTRWVDTDNDGVDDDGDAAGPTFDWEPGFYLVPSITVYF